MGSWYRVSRSSQAVSAHGSLLVFTVLLVMKLDCSISYSWWIIFVPLWLFHSVTARGRFSLPAPLHPRGLHWAPCHAVVATPLVVSFELLLCVFLESLWVHRIPAVNLKIVFLPLLAFEIVILIDNFRMCKALMPGDEESINDEAIWETLPHFWVAISMVFFVAATIFLLLKLSGDVAALGWWDLFINFGIAQCFSFLVCTKWTNPSIHPQPYWRGPSSSSQATRCLDGNSGLLVTDDEDENTNSMCSPQDIGGHIMKIPLIVFQIFLCMRLEGMPISARRIPLVLLFFPLFLVQGVGFLLAILRLVENIVLLRNTRTTMDRYFSLFYRLHDCFGFLHHGSRLLGWWSIDERSREEHARLFHSANAGYNTFSGHSPELVKKMPKKVLAEEVWRLHAVLGEQAEITKCSQQEYERLQHDKVLCRICFESEIRIVLLPCRHRLLCSICSDKCKKCPICRVIIEEHMPVYDV